MTNTPAGGLNIGARARSRGNPRLWQCRGRKSGAGAETEKRISEIAISRRVHKCCVSIIRQNEIFVNLVLRARSWQQV